MSHLPGLDLALFREMASPNEVVLHVLKSPLVMGRLAQLVLVGKGESTGLEVSPEVVTFLAADGQPEQNCDFDANPLGPCLRCH